MIPDWLFVRVDDAAAMMKLMDRDRSGFHQLYGIGQRRRDMPKVDALLRAGWSIEWPEHDSASDLYQWKWRRPPKRPGKPGRLFHSTDQAFNALQKEPPPCPTT